VFDFTGWDSDNTTGNNDLLPDSASAGVYLGVNSATDTNLLDDFLGHDIVLLGENPVMREGLPHTG
jgi:hypothetical protein|tara:strand:+ start:24 stop:221 length:198 start_codon:yes stop_codon:yes gene_type:complete